MKLLATFFLAAVGALSCGAAEPNRTIITSREPVPAGKSTVRFDFAYDGGELGSGGLGTLFINGKKLARSVSRKPSPVASASILSALAWTPAPLFPTPTSRSSPSPVRSTKCASN